MLSRRDLLKGTGAGLLLIASPPLLHIPLKLVLDSPNSARPEIVADCASADAAAFIRAASGSSRTASVIGVDGTQFVSQLAAAWAKNPYPLVGLTQTSVAVVVEAIAREHGLAVAYRGWHRYGDSGEITHSLYGGHATLRRLGDDLKEARARWASVLGANLAEVTKFDERPEPARITVRASHAERSGVLASWAIVPVKFAPWV